MQPCTVLVVSGCMAFRVCNSGMSLLMFTLLQPSRVKPACIREQCFDFRSLKVYLYIREQCLAFPLKVYTH